MKPEVLGTDQIYKMTNDNGQYEQGDGCGYPPGPVIDPGTFGGGAEFALVGKAAGGTALPDNGTEAGVRQVLVPCVAKVEGDGVGEICSGRVGLPTGRFEAVHTVDFDAGEEVAIAGDFVEKLAAFLRGLAQENGHRQIHDEDGGESELKGERIPNDDGAKGDGDHCEQENQHSVPGIAGIRGWAEIWLTPEDEKRNDANKQGGKDGPTDDWIVDVEKEEIEGDKGTENRKCEMVGEVEVAIFRGERIVDSFGKLEQDGAIGGGQEKGVFRKFLVGAEAAREWSGAAFVEIEHCIVDGEFFAREVGRERLGGAEDCVVFVEALEGDEAAGGEVENGCGDGLGIERAGEGITERAGGEILGRTVLGDDGARSGTRADPIAGSEVVEDKQARDEEIESRIGRIETRSGWCGGE